MKIELKDLVWKEIDKRKELNDLRLKWEIKNDDKLAYTTKTFYFNNAEQIAKEKAEVLNKEPQYTKDDIIEMFVEAGFVTNKDGNYDFDMIYTLDIGESDDYNITICIYDKHIKFMYWCEDNDDALITQYLNFNDRKSIEFYYNKFREILEFEVGND